MPTKNANFNYAGLSSLYRKNPYHARADALMSRSSFQNAGFAGPGLALVAGRQMAQGDVWEQRNQDRLDQQMNQKDDKQDMELKTKVLTLAVNAAKQGNNGLAVEIINGNRDVLGMSADKYVSAFQLDKAGTVFTKIETKGTKAGGAISIGFTKDGQAWRYGGGPNGEAVPMTQEDWASIGKTAQEKDARTSTQKDYETWKGENPNGTLDDFYVAKKGTGDQKLTGDPWFFDQINKERSAAGQAPMSAEEYVSQYKKPKKAVDPAAQTLVDKLNTWAPGGGKGAAAPAPAPAAQQKALDELKRRGKLPAPGPQSSLDTSFDEEDPDA